MLTVFPAGGIRSPLFEKEKKRCSRYDTSLCLLVFGDLVSVEYLFIDITLKPTLTQSDNTC